MSNIYIINNTSGEALFAIQPKATNGPGSAGHNTDLTLYGYGAPNWGERFNENFYRLLENFACAEKEPGDTGYSALSPAPKSEGDVGVTEKYGVNKPVLGQTWFNTTRDKLFVCTQTDPVVIWSYVASDDTESAYVQKAGDTMTGFLTLHATPVQNMHAATKQYVDAGLASAVSLFVRKSGDIMNTGQTLVLGRDPIGDMDAVTKQYVDSIAGTPGPINDPVKIGTVVPFAGSGDATPNNWLLCDGRAVSRTTYSRLYGVIGNTYGSGDGTTTFNLPDLRGRIAVGKDNMGGTSANVVTSTSADLLGGMYGNETHTLTLNEMPSHTHTGSSTAAGGHSHTGTAATDGGHTHSIQIVSSGSGTSGIHNGSGTITGSFSTATGGDHTHSLTISSAGEHSHTMSLNSTGSGTAHNNMQPSITMNYIIKAIEEQTTLGGGGTGDYVARGGDSMYGSLTMTGATDITLARAPTLPMHAVNKQYVDDCCAGSSGGTGEPTWTYRTTITTTTLLSTASYVNCGSTPTFTVPGTGTRKCIISAHVPIDVYGYPNQIFIRMLLDGNVVDHNSFNINLGADAPHAGQALSFSYTGDIAAGPHTVSFQGKLDTTSTLESGDWVRVNGAHGLGSNTNVDAYTRVDVFVDGTGSGTGGTIVDPVKIGTISPFAGTTVPTNWLLCNGQAVSRTTYDELFSAISTTYGAGDGSTTFNVPDLRGRTTIGLDNMGGTSANVVGAAAADTIGGKFGTETHTLTTNEMPSHNHTGYFPQQGGTQIQSGTGWGNNFLNTSNTGGGQAHNNMQPSMALNYIIKAKSEGVAIGGSSESGGEPLTGLTFVPASTTTASVPTLLATGILTKTGTGWQYSQDYTITMPSVPPNASHAMIRVYILTNSGGNNGLVGFFKTNASDSWTPKVSTDPTGNGTDVAWEGEGWATIVIPISAANTIMFRLGINRDAGSTVTEMSAAMYLEGYFIQESASVGTGTPASPANSIQFNNSGAFGGSAKNVWNNTNNIQTISGGASQNRLTLQSGAETLNTTQQTNATLYIQVDTSTQFEGMRTHFNRATGHSAWITYHYDVDSPNIRLTDEDDDPPYVAFSTIGTGTYDDPLYVSTFGARGGYASRINGNNSGFAWHIGANTNPRAMIVANTPVMELDSQWLRIPVGTTAQRPASPTDGMIRYNTTTSKLEGHESGGWANLVQSADENYIINGNFDIWERMNALSSSGGALVNPPTSFSITSANQQIYTADRWFLSTSSLAGTYSTTITRITPTAGDVSGFKQYDLQWTIANATNTVYFGQKIEHVSTLSNGNIVVSFTAKQTTGATTPLVVTAIQYFGLGGSPNVVTSSSPVSLSGTMQTYQVVLAIPSIAGKTIEPDSFLQIAFEPSTPSVSGVTYVFSRVQVEEGTTATKYKFRSIGTEQDLCARYYQQGYFAESKNATPYIAGLNALTNETWIPFTKTMRKEPIVTHAFAWGSQTGIYPEGALGYGPTTNGPYPNATKPNGIYMQFAGFSIFPSGGGDASLAGWWQANAEL